MLKVIAKVLRRWMDDYLMVTRSSLCERGKPGVVFSHQELLVLLNCVVVVVVVVCEGLIFYIGTWSFAHRLLERLAEFPNLTRGRYPSVVRVWIRPDSPTNKPYPPEV